LPLLRDQFTVDNVGTVFREQAVDGRLSLGPELRF
jgi:hypothetical protein